MTSFIFETIIEISAAFRNVYAQLVPMNRGLASRYMMLIKVSGATARWPFTDSAVPSSLLLLFLLLLLLF